MLDNENTILEQEKKKQKSTNLTVFPNIFIKDSLFKGTLSVRDLYFSMCSHLN